MPPKARVGREDIVRAGFDLVRSRGAEALSVRAIAGALGCSTQPVLYWFKTAEEIRREVYKAADEFHSRYLMEPPPEGEDPLLALGMNYIRFAREERPLFRFLFQSNSFAGRDLTDLLDDPALDEMISLAGRGIGGEAAARRAFRALFIAAHGCASLLANNALVCREEEAEAILKDAFRGALSAGREEEK